jgi:molybdopterin-guanine dinucleotide biosynthesis protein A
MPRSAAIVLAGGRSARMGTPKAGLEWHGSTLLARVAGVVGAAVGPVVVVRAPGQALPALPAGVRVAEDAREGRGPLEGLRAGLRAMEPGVDGAYVAAVDLPFLTPEAVRRALGALAGGAEAAVPRAEGRAHPLAAAYRPDVLPVVEGLLAEGRAKMADLLERLEVAWLEEEPGVLRNLNTPSDYARARALPPPPAAGGIRPG